LNLEKILRDISENNQELSIKAFNDIKIYKGEDLSIEENLKNLILNLITKTKTTSDFKNTFKNYWDNEKNWKILEVEKKQSSIFFKNNPEKDIVDYIKIGVQGIEDLLISSNVNLDSIRAADFKRTRIRKCYSELLNLFLTDGSSEKHPCMNISLIGIQDSEITPSLNILSNCKNGCCVLLTSIKDTWRCLIIRKIKKEYEHFVVNGKIPSIKKEPLPILYGGYSFADNKYVSFPYGKDQPFGTFIKLFEYEFSGNFGNTSASWDLVRHLDTRIVKSLLEVNILDRKSKLSDSLSGHLAKNPNCRAAVLGLNWRILKDIDVRSAFELIKQTTLPFQDKKYPITVGIFKESYDNKGHWRSSGELAVLTFEGFTEATISKAVLENAAVDEDIKNRLLVILDCGGFTKEQKKELLEKENSKIMKLLEKSLKDFILDFIYENKEANKVVVSKEELNKIKGISALTKRSPEFQSYLEDKTYIDRLSHSQFLSLIGLSNTATSSEIQKNLDKRKISASDYPVILQFLSLLENRFKNFIAGNEKIDIGKITKIDLTFD